jgi:hypothetical protein
MNMNLVLPDIRGYDGSDLAVFADAFGSWHGDANYDPDADFDGSGGVDLVDPVPKTDFYYP